jgi:archaemetzincin
LLDACIEALPDDAYALLLVVEQDTYEDEDDDFCCGRAFGGSRVAVVSTARYHPLLDTAQGIDREHTWPASHCTAYMEKCCAEENFEEEKPPARRVVDLSPSSSSKVSSPMHLALGAHASHVNPLSSRALSELFLSRLYKTAAHELGHCFGIDHCTYYACIMQGSASVREDARQPPYLCPIDEAKVLRATGAEVTSRDQAVARLCKDHRDGQLFAALEAWLESKLAAI